MKDWTQENPNSLHAAESDFRSSDEWGLSGFPRWVGSSGVRDLFTALNFYLYTWIFRGFVGGNKQTNRNLQLSWALVLGPGPNRIRVCLQAFFLHLCRGTFAHTLLLCFWNVSLLGEERTPLRHRPLQFTAQVIRLTISTSFTQLLCLFVSF